MQGLGLCGDDEAPNWLLTFPESLVLQGSWNIATIGVKTHYLVEYVALKAAPSTLAGIQRLNILAEGGNMSGGTQRPTLFPVVFAYSST